MSSPERREQLLDAVLSLILRTGSTHVTVESAAVAAGVSKALLYAHFQDLDDLLAALYFRETNAVSQAVTVALGKTTADQDRVAVLVRSYFDAVEERGAVLALLTAPGAVKGGAETDLGPRFAGVLLIGFLGMDSATALAGGHLLLGLLTSGSAALRSEPERRNDVERLVVAAVRGLLPPRD